MSASVSASVSAIVCKRECLSCCLAGEVENDTAVRHGVVRVCLGLGDGDAVACVSAREVRPQH